MRNAIAHIPEINTIVYKAGRPEDGTDPKLISMAEVLVDLLADPEVSPHVRRLEGAATVAVVQGAGIEQVRSALQARGMELAEHPL